jgi:hypothetical protein
VLRRIFVPAAGLWLLRILLPLCLLAGTAVAVQGLVRVVGTGQAAPVADRSASLRLGTAGAGRHPVTLPHSPAPAPQQTARPAPAGAAPPTPAVPVTPVPVTPVQVTRPVDIVNASDIRGLATRTAAVLRARGVPVASVGNLTPAQHEWRGDGPTRPTVFYPPGDDLQARTLATMAHAPVVAPAPRWLPSQGRLVLVVTAASDGPSARS